MTVRTLSTLLISVGLLAIGYFVWPTPYSQLPPALASDGSMIELRKYRITSQVERKMKDGTWLPYVAPTTDYEILISPMRESVRQADRAIEDIRKMNADANAAMDKARADAPGR